MKAATAAARADRSVPERGIAGRHRAVPAERLLQVAGRLSRSGRRGDARGVRAHRRRRACCVQIDAPDLAMGRHTMYRDRSVEEFLNRAAKHIEVLNHALRNVPADRVRMHVCWGNYEGPHHHDVPLERLLPVVVRAKIGGTADRGRESAPRARMGGVPRLPRARGHGS